MLVGLLVASSSGAFFARRQSGPLTLRGDLLGGVHTIRLSSTIVPKDVVRMAAQRSGVLTKGGGVPSAAAVSAFAQRINAWYRANGYVLARVQGCRPVVAGRLELEAFEPRVAREPVRNPQPHPKPNPNPNPSPSPNLSGAGKYKYLGGVLGPDGRIYCIPSDADRVLRIDPATHECVEIGETLEGRVAWLGLGLGEPRANPWRQSRPG